MRSPKFVDARPIWLFIAILIPFLLNDFSNIYITNYRVWLAIDFVSVKLFPLLLVFYFLHKEILKKSDFGLIKIPIKQFIGYSVALTILGIFIDQFGWRFFDMILPGSELGGIPGVENPILFRVNLYLGLLLVAVVEELVFRGLSFTIMKRYTDNIATILILSSVIFGLIHWSFGLHGIVSTALIGMLFMYAVWKTGSIYPSIAAHFFVNYFAFSGIIPYDSPVFSFIKN
jgi:hypothetical protein